MLWWISLGVWVAVDFTVWIFIGMRFRSLKQDNLRLSEE